MSVYRPAGADALSTLWGTFFGDKDKQGVISLKSIVRLKVQMLTFLESRL